jgi:hypothetical protein
VEEDASECDSQTCCYSSTYAKGYFEADSSAYGKGYAETSRDGKTCGYRKTRSSSYAEAQQFNVKRIQLGGLDAK